MKNLKFLSIGLLSALSLFSCSDDDDFTQKQETAITAKKPLAEIGPVKDIKYKKMMLLYDCEDHVYNVDNFGYIISDEESTFYFYRDYTRPGIYMRTQWNLVNAYVTAPETSSDWITEKYNDNLFYFEYVGDTWYGYEYVNDWTLDIVILKRL